MYAHWHLYSLEPERLTPESPYHPFECRIITLCRNTRLFSNELDMAFGGTGYIGHYTLASAFPTNAPLRSKFRLVTLLSLDGTIVTLSPNV